MSPTLFLLFFLCFAGVKHLVFPEGNRRDWDELTDVSFFPFLFLSVSLSLVFPFPSPMRGYQAALWSWPSGSGSIDSHVLLVRSAAVAPAPEQQADVSRLMPPVGRHSLEPCSADAPPLTLPRLVSPPVCPTQDVKAGLEPHFVDHYDQIYRLAFQGEGPRAELVAAAA